MPKSDSDDEKGARGGRNRSKSRNKHDKEKNKNRKESPERKGKGKNREGSKNRDRDKSKDGKHHRKDEKHNDERGRNGGKGKGQRGGKRDGSNDQGRSNSKGDRADSESREKHNNERGRNGGEGKGQRGGKRDGSNSQGRSKSKGDRADSETRGGKGKPRARTRKKKGLAAKDDYLSEDERDSGEISEAEREFLERLEAEFDLKEATIDILWENDLDSLEALASISNKDIEDFGLSLGQTNLLKNCVAKLKTEEAGKEQGRSTQGVALLDNDAFRGRGNNYQAMDFQRRKIKEMVDKENQSDPKYQEYMAWKRAQEEAIHVNKFRQWKGDQDGKQKKKKGKNKKQDRADEKEEAEGVSEEQAEAERAAEMAKLKEMLEYEKQKTREALEKMSSQKEEMRQAFIDELMRRQKASGTFEETQGTVAELKEYNAEDPVTVWYGQEKGLDITGKKWDALKDSQYLYNAMDGAGTNEAAIISVTTTRCNAQRQKIRLEFKTAYGKDLIREIKSELSFRFKEAILSCYESPARYDAWSVKNAIYGLGTDDRCLIEILMTQTNEQMKEMRDEYNKITHKKQRDPESSIERDIEDDTSGDFKRLLISSTTANRRQVTRENLEEAVEEIQFDGKFTGMYKINYEKLADQDECEFMAQELNKAGEEKWGTDEATFNRIFSTQDFYTLRSVYDKYVKLTQRDILKSVDRETSGNFKKGLCTVIQCVKNKPSYYATAIHRSMKGLGTDDSTLIRICVSRSEIDMVQIKACFLEQYKQTMWQYINDDCSGDYRKLLQAIVGRD